MCAAMNPGTTKYVCALAFAASVVLLAACNTRPPLPHLGPHDVFRDDHGAADTVYYTIPKFAFTNQEGQEVTHHDYDGHVYVADFFFSNCPSICPIMSSQMARLQENLRSAELLGRVKLLSHTVDPVRDTLEALAAYADRIGADLDHWHFVTGAPELLYKQAEHGYLMTAFPSDTAAGGFFHTDQFALIDREGHIRGYYDGTSTASVDALFEDIQHLLKHAP